MTKILPLSYCNVFCRSLQAYKQCQKHFAWDQHDCAPDHLSVLLLVFNRSDTPGATDPLLLHLKDLKAQGAKLDPALFAAVGRCDSKMYQFCQASWLPGETGGVFETAAVGSFC
jgi:hypothetical protein